MEWFSYLLKVMACQACFLLVYQVLLKPAGMHRWSRIYLGVVILLSFMIPLLHVQIQTENPLPMSVLEEEFVIPFEQAFIGDNQSPNPVQSDRTWGTVLLYVAIGIYLLIATFLLVKYFVNLKVIITQIKKLPYDKLKGIKFYETDGLGPYSFFESVFIPRDIKSSQGYAQVVEHELAHARHWHSLDRIIIDFIVALLWFNPFIYWYRNALKAVHEFQADEQVLKRFPDKIAYQEILYLQLFKPVVGLASHFNATLIKKRIVMMNRKKINLYRWLPVLSIPAILCLSLAFSLKEVHEPVELALQHHLNLGPDTHLSPQIELPQKEDIPDISPIKASDLTRMSSAFGMRKDPRTKVRKHHRGVDFSAPIGTDVYATADGVIKTAQSRKGGYGIMVEITHGDEGEYTTRYAHMDSYQVEVGQEVKKGEIIGKVGNSGLSYGPHLHYEVHVDGKPVDPQKYITEK
ncbi:MAG: M23/M56 family metallopeptidase [Cytophagales bacterium]|nr:M23/M56 family metallopeptidase [Cytophagales bacterium]